MSNSLNKVELIGNLGRNPEFRMTSTGKQVVELAIATSYTDKEKKQFTTWHRVVAWGNMAQMIKDKLAKGDRIRIEGRLENRSFEGKDGQKHFMVQVVANNVMLLNKKTQKETTPEQTSDLSVSDMIF